MGNTFSADPYARGYYKTYKPPSRQEKINKAQREIANAKKMLSGITQGHLPTTTQLNLINFNKERYCSVTTNRSCEERSVPKKVLLNMYKKYTENFIKYRQDNISKIPPTQTPYKPYTKTQSRPQQAVRMAKPNGRRRSR
jgi:hypothetical protein